VPVSRTQSGCKADFSATLENIEEFCAQVEGFLTDLNYQEEIFPVMLLLREAATNAVVHGSEGNPNLSVACSVEIQEGWLVIEVNDQGPGFDWRTAIRQEPDPTSTSGRGVSIYRLYADSVVFNDKGNQVVMKKKLNKDGSAMREPKVTKDGNAVALAPSEDIVAASVPDFRARIKSLIDEGVKEMTIDLEKVLMVDSTGIGLLVQTHNSLSRAGGKLTVVRANKDLLELFKAMRLDQHFSINA